MKLKCAHPIKQWNAAKRHAKAVLIERAKAGDVISYFELTRNSSTPQSFALTTMLREIVAEENRADGTGSFAAWPRFLCLGWSAREIHQRRSAVLDQRTQAGASQPAAWSGASLGASKRT